ncbi:MAG: hypothetical protein A2Y94_13030 [Caldithrix sp. RBG_13_44_9]|nr:MAG: hypothetical protein A2Y94_13030 [Caldithrix sp. RBG_13_44_9]
MIFKGHVMIFVKNLVDFISENFIIFMLIYSVIRPMNGNRIRGSIKKVNLILRFMPINKN